MPSAGAGGQITTGPCGGGACGSVVMPSGGEGGQLIYGLVAMPEGGDTSVGLVIQPGDAGEGGVSQGGGGPCGGHVCGVVINPSSGGTAGGAG
ncbi:MAG: hypothetical protein ABI548_27645 [Polyangiaceae bacterium]